MFDIPIAIIIFNRPSFVQKIYYILQEIEPKDLYIISDAARENMSGEREKVQVCRSILEDPKWNCNIHLEYAETNMGCDKRIKSGLDWLFSKVEYAIILEDDCVPDKSFFYYCAELLKRYKGNDNVQYIAGSNQIDTHPIIYTSYIFTYGAWTLGWASWARAWNNQRELLDDYAKVKKEIMFLNFLPLSEKLNMIRTLRTYKNKGFFPWDMNFTWSALLEKKLSVVPKTNLVNHIGFNEEATHVKEPFAGYDGTTIPLDFPLKHPQIISEEKRYHTDAYNWNRETILHKLCDIEFYKRQINKVWKKRR